MIEVLKQALEAFAFMPNEIIKQKGVQEAITSLRQAIAELESQEPVACVNGCSKFFKYAKPQQRTKIVFPTMLRKMWSGGEVQAWLDENVNKENKHD